MDYKVELQNNNTDLESIINRINALPDADGSNSGTGIDFSTCSAGIKEMVIFRGKTISIPMGVISTSFNSVVNE